MPQLTRRFLSLWLVAMTASLGFAAFSYRPMFSDGAFLFYRIPLYYIYIHDYPHHRYFSYVFQAPMFWVLKHLCNINPELAFYCLSFGLSLHPIAGLLGTLYVLKRFDRLDLLVFPLFSFAVVTMAAVSFSVGGVIDALTVFWPLFFLVTLPRRRSWKGALAIVVLSATLVITHEAAIMFFGLLALLAAIEARRDRPNRWFHLLSLGISVVAMAWLAYCALQTGSGHGNFVRSLLLASTAFLIYVYAAIAAVLLPLAASFVFKSKAKQLARLMVLFYLAAVAWLVTAYILNLGGIYQVWTAFHARAVAVPLVAVLAAAAYLASRLETQPKWRNEAMQRALIGVVALALVLGTAYDLTLTGYWRKGIANLRQVFERDQDCVVLDREFFHKQLSPYGLGDWTMPYLSIILQIKHASRTMVYVTPNPGADVLSVELCEANRKGFIIAPYNQAIPLRELFPDFHEVPRF